MAKAQDKDSRRAADAKAKGKDGKKLDSGKLDDVAAGVDVSLGILPVNR